MLASRLGYAAVNALLEGKTQMMAGIINDKVVFTPFVEVVKKHSRMNEDMIEMIKVLSV